MKTTKILITSLLAAAALSVPAWADVTIADGQTTAATDQNVTAGAVTIGAGSTYQWNRSGNGTWVITSLNGTTADTDTSGSLVYLNRQNNGTFTATLLLSGDNDFAGTIKVTNTSSTIDAIANQRGHANAFIVLNSVGAAQNATVCVGGDGSNGATSATHAQERLVVGVDGAKVAGLTGVVPKATVISRGNMTQTSGYYNNDAGAYDSSDTTVRTLELTGSGTYAFAGVVEQNVSLNKTGSGTQTFSGEVNSGVVSLSAGTLVLSGTANIANSLTVTGGTLTLSGTNTLNGTFTATGGSLSLGGALNLASAISVTDSVSLTIADTVVFGLGGLTGTKDEEDATKTTFSLISGKTLGEDWTSLGLANIDLVSANVGTRGASVTFLENGSVELSASRADLVWNGTSANSTWNTETTNKIWTNNNLSTEDKADSFYMLDNVTFDSSASSKSVSLVSGAVIQAGTVEVSDDYTFKTTSGTSTLKGSKLTVASGTTLSLGDGDLKTVALDFDDISLSGKIRYQNGASTWKKLTFAATDAELFIYDLTSGTGLTINELALSANGKITAQFGGTVAIGSITGAGDLSIAGPGGTEAITFTVGALSGSGKISTVAGTGTGALNVEIGGNNSSFTGTFEINAGTVKLTSSQNTLGATDSAAAGERYAAVVKTGGTLDINGQTQGGNNCYKIELAGGALVNNGSTVGANQCQITGLKLSADSTIGGSGNFGLISSYYASNILTLNGHTLTKTGANTFYLISTTIGAGTIDVQEGVLWLGNGDASTELFSMDSGATIKLNGGTITAGSQSTANAPKVALGNVAIVFNDANKDTARITVASGCNFTVASSAVLRLDIGALTEATLTGEQVALTIAAASAFDNSFFSAVEVGTYVDDAWQISSEWKYLADSWDVGAGTLKISAIPEPSAFGLLAGLGALALAGTRRRRRK